MAWSVFQENADLQNCHDGTILLPQPQQYMGFSKKQVCNNTLKQYCVLALSF